MTQTDKFWGSPGYFLMLLAFNAIPIISGYPNIFTWIAVAISLVALGGYTFDWLFDKLDSDRVIYLPSPEDDTTSCRYRLGTPEKYQMCELHDGHLGDHQWSPAVITSYYC